MKVKKNRKKIIVFEKPVLFGIDKYELQVRLNPNSDKPSISFKFYGCNILFHNDLIWNGFWQRRDFILLLKDLKKEVKKI